MNKKDNSEVWFLVVVVIILILVIISPFNANAAVKDNININCWREDVDYMGQMLQILHKDTITQTEYELAETYEELRNAKIAGLAIVDYPQTVYFATHGYNSTAILEDYYYVEPESELPKADDYDVDILARVLYLEAGSSWIPDWVIEYCASVVVNRINHSYYPDSVEGVLSQRGQFSTWSMRNRITPTDRCYTIARDVLETGSKIDSNVIYFANFTQGNGVYETYYNPYGGNLYFCRG